MPDTTSLVLNIIFSSIGLGYFMYGRSQTKLIARYSGIALMVYPYFITNNYAVVAIGLVLMALPRFMDV